MARLLSRLVALLALVACSKEQGTVTAKADEPGSGSEIRRKVLERMPIAGTDEEVRLMLVEYPPGVSAPAHRHPVAGLCYVIEGTAESQYEGEAKRTFQAGDSYQDLPATKHLLFRNTSTTSRLRFTCAAKIGKEQEFAQPL